MYAEPVKVDQNAKSGPKYFNQSSPRHLQARIHQRLKVILTFYGDTYGRNRPGMNLQGFGHNFVGAMSGHQRALTFQAAELETPN